MLYYKFLPTLLSLPLLALAHPAYPYNHHQRAPPMQSRSTPGGDGSANPHCFTGTQFAPKSDWKTFQTLWQQALHTYGSANSQQENKAIHDGITWAGQQTQLDPAVILSLTIQESSLRANVPNKGPAQGLLQVHGCPQSCAGKPKGQCSAGQIYGMYACAVDGAAGFGGLKKCQTRYGGQVGEVVRCFNSGSVVDPQDLSKGPGTPSYVSDISNRLMGFQPPKCG